MLPALRLYPRGGLLRSTRFSRSGPSPLCAPLTRQTKPGVGTEGRRAVWKGGIFSRRERAELLPCQPHSATGSAWLPPSSSPALQCLLPLHLPPLEPGLLTALLGNTPQRGSQQEPFVWASALRGGRWGFQSSLEIPWAFPSLGGREGGMCVCDAEDRTANYTNPHPPSTPHIQASTDGLFSPPGNEHPGFHGEHLTGITSLLCLSATPVQSKQRIPGTVWLEASCPPCRHPHAGDGCGPRALP